MRRRRGAAALAMGAAAMLGLAGCAVAPPGAGPNFTPARFSDLPGWPADHLAEALPPLLESCARLATLPPDQVLGGAGAAAARGGQAGQWTETCAAARAVPPADDAAARQFFESALSPWEVRDGESATVLFTGYYEPEVAGSRTRTGPYQVPLYARPPDLVQLDAGAENPADSGQPRYVRLVNGQPVPYWSRAEINAGVLARRHLELLWLRDPVDLFVLQVQGSGRVRLPNGQLVRVAYAGKNGLPYVPIGRVIAERSGTDPAAITMPMIRAWLADHPEERQSVLEANPSYVFFREVSGGSPDLGPPGTLGVPLTPLRSVAVDRKAVPLAAPVWVATHDPASGAPLERLMMAQDLGAAISGALRTDIFFGWGEEAETRAGLARQKGAEWVLLPVGARPGS